MLHHTDILRGPMNLRPQNAPLKQFHTSKIAITSWVFYKTIKPVVSPGLSCNNPMLDNLLVTRRYFHKNCDGARPGPGWVGELR